MAGAHDLADSMSNDDLVFHVKDHGDGYGHIIYNAYACGRPTIIRRSLYDNQLAQELFNDESSINLDGISIEDAVHKVKKVLSDEELLNNMSIKAYEAFKNNVDFAYDAEKVYNWMGTL
jgi:glycosyltransferase involved in cell wall biosynthesis